MEGETEKTNAVSEDDVLNAAPNGKPENIEPDAVVLDTQKKDAVVEDDQQFRSRLGRRVSKIEEKIDDFINEMRFVRNKPESFQTNASSDEAYVSTAADVRKVLQNIEQERAANLKSYENNYLNHLTRLGIDEGLSDAEIVRLEELVKSSFNVTYSRYTDPVSDAERNFLKAMRVIDRERSKGSSRQVNLKGEIPKGTSPNLGTEMIDKELPPVKLDTWAQDFVNYHKIPNKKVASMLNSEGSEESNKK